MHQRPIIGSTASWRKTNGRSHKTSAAAGPSHDARWTLVVRVRRGHRAPREASAPLGSFAACRRVDRRLPPSCPSMQAPGTPWGTPHSINDGRLARRLPADRASCGRREQAALLLEAAARPSPWQEPCSPPRHLARRLPWREGAGSSRSVVDRLGPSHPDVILHRRPNTRCQTDPLG